jgi:hypothetical protein
MNSATLKISTPDADASHDAERASGHSFGSLRARAKELLAANINPRTGLATDYLNHFNEAIMLLEMIPDMPECTDDFLGWQPLSYSEHFKASNFKARDLAISSYEMANPVVRDEFDNLTYTMTSILTAVGGAMRQVKQDKSRAELALQATGWVKPLVMLAGGIINGPGHSPMADDKAAIDEIMSGP